MRSVAKQDILAVRQAVVCNLVGACSVAHGVRICRKASGGTDDADARASVELVADGLLVVDDAHQLRHGGCALADGQVCELRMGEGLRSQPAVNKTGHAHTPNWPQAR